MNKLQRFINNRPALQLTALGREMGYNNRSYFRRLVLEKSGEKMSPIFAMKLAHALCGYGLELDGWTFEHDTEIPNHIFAYKFVTGENEEEIDKGDHVKYVVKIYRKNWDEADFFSFIRE